MTIYNSNYSELNKLSDAVVVLMNGSMKFDSLPIISALGSDLVTTSVLTPSLPSPPGDPTQRYIRPVGRTQHARPLGGDGPPGDGDGRGGAAPAPAPAGGSG